MVLKKDTTDYYGHKGKWLLISRHADKRTGRRRVLRIYGKKPSKKQVRIDERIIDYYKRK
jgi:hypothetical protein